MKVKTKNGFAPKICQDLRSFENRPKVDGRRKKQAKPASNLGISGIQEVFVCVMVLNVNQVGISTSCGT